MTARPLGVAVVTAFVCVCVCAPVFVDPLRSQWVFAHWPKVDATVAEYKEVRYSGGPRLSLFRVYRYELDGREQLAMGPDVAGPHARDELPIGTRLVVARDPKDPASALSSWDAKHNPYTFIERLYAAVIIVACAGFVALSAWAVLRRR